jgi:hypothetical protein
MRKASRLLFLETLEKFLGCGVRFVMEPKEDIRPDRLKRVLTSAPIVGLLWGSAMGSTDFPLSPQLS